MSALVVLTTAFALAVVTRMMKMRLGTNGTVILFDRGDGVAKQFPLREVKSDGNHLLLGKSMVPMKTRRLALFDPADLESLILSRVPAAGRVSSTKLFLASLKAGNAAHWFTVGLFVLIVAVQLLETFRPDLYRDILLIWHDSQPRG
jgi:hypothetical protein